MGGRCRRHSCAGNGDERIRRTSLFNSPGCANNLVKAKRVLTQPSPETAKSRTELPLSTEGDHSHDRDWRATQFEAELTFMASAGGRVGQEAAIRSGLQQLTPTRRAVPLLLSNR